MDIGIGFTAWSQLESWIEGEQQLAESMTAPAIRVAIPSLRRYNNSSARLAKTSPKVQSHPLILPQSLYPVCDMSSNEKSHRMHYDTSSNSALSRQLFILIGPLNESINGRWPSDRSKEKILLYLTSASRFTNNRHT